MAAINRLVGRSSQFLIATHSPILFAGPGAQILEFGDGPVQPVAYEETEQYRVTKAFLEHPERMFRELFRDDD